MTVVEFLNKKSNRFLLPHEPPRSTALVAVMISYLGLSMKKHLTEKCIAKVRLSSESEKYIYVCMYLLKEEKCKSNNESSHHCMVIK